MDATTFDEAAAVLEARNGSRVAFEALVKAYQRRAYAIAYGFVGNREDALDLAQEAFARAYRAMDRFDTKMPFYPWFYRIVRNACLTHLKKKKRHGEVSLTALVASGYQVTDGEARPAQAAELEELRREIAGALEGLTPEHREIIVLRHLQELSYSEIAACLGIPKGTVMSRLYSARRSLRSVLEDRGTVGNGKRSDKVR
ncbi:MAG: sigma-70 family RNA polymerase sigma factor [Nitrospiraceae bacterium]|nr:sigma-70 family RNA polymerase sigma factor [Nitrospiraceae bacterium]